MVRRDEMQSTPAPRRRAAVVALLILVAAAGSTSAAPTDVGFHVELRPSTPATPAAPARGAFGVELRIDDGSSEGIVGLAGGGTRQFLFFNRFDDPGGMILEEMWVLFPSGTDVAPGDAIELVVYHDPDSDPTNGATLLGSYDVTVQSTDGTSFSMYPLAPPVLLPPGGDVILGAINRYHQTGVDPNLTEPAALDTTASQSRSWIALWTGDPPSPPDLAGADIVDLLAGASAGNLMIRGFGSPAFDAAIPTLGGVGLLVLVTLIAAAGVVLQHLAAGRAGG